MPSILQINVIAKRGSTGRIVQGLRAYSVQQNWKSYIAYGRGEAISQSELFKIGLVRDVLLHVLSTRIFDNHGLVSKCTTRNLIHKIQKLNLISFIYTIYTAII